MPCRHHVTATVLLVSLQHVLVRRESGQEIATASTFPAQPPFATPRQENGVTYVVEAEARLGQV